MLWTMDICLGVNAGANFSSDHLRASMRASAIANCENNFCGLILRAILTPVLDLFRIGFEQIRIVGDLHDLVVQDIDANELGEGRQYVARPVCPRRFGWIGQQTASRASADLR
jgi:hypothetical protein